MINDIIVRRDVVFDEAFTSSMPTMLGKYTRDIAELREQERMIDDENPFRVAQPKPRRKPTQADVDKLWTPSVYAYQALILTRMTNAAQLPTTPPANLPVEAKGKYASTSRNNAR